MRIGCIQRNWQNINCCSILMKISTRLIEGFSLRCCIHSFENLSFSLLFVGTTDSPGCRRYHGCARDDATTTKGSQPQVKRLKSIGQQLQEFLGGSDAAQSDHASRSQIAAGEIEERNGYIERMTSKLNDITQKTKEGMATSTTLDISKSVNVRFSSEWALMTDSIDISEGPRQVRRRGYKPLSLNERSSSSYSRFNIPKLTEEWKRCVNPYGVIDKITKETGRALKRVFGNNRMSLTVKVRRREQGEKICGLKDVDGVRCQIELHAMHNFTNFMWTA